MSKYRRGDIVVVPFPFSGAPGEKPRPELVLAAVPYANKMDYTDVQGGALIKKSYLRPTYLFTTGENRIARKAGVMNTDKVDLALSVLANLFQ